MTSTLALSFVAEIFPISPPLALLAVLVALGAVTALYELRVRRIQNREKQLTALLEERTRALTDNERQLHQLANDLDERVSERTIELIRLNEALQVEGQELRRKAQLSTAQDLRKLQLLPPVFHPRQLLQQTLASFAARANEKGVDFRQMVASDVPAMLPGDDNPLRQILVNLVENALQFTAAGTVTASISVLEQDASAVTLQFSVADTGTGISNEKRALILEGFAQADKLLTTETAGTGIGLKICGQLAAQMKGRIWVESELGQGSRFHFAATFDRQETHADSAIPSLSANALLEKIGMKVLLVEDNPINQRLAVRLLEKQGYQVTVAGNGREALQTLDRSGWNFDAALMDIQMPEMDGLEATREIRRLESAGNRRLPIIAVTAHALKRDRERCLAAGMDDYVSKPIDTVLLLGLLRDIAAKKLNSEANVLTQQAAPS